MYKIINGIAPSHLVELFVHVHVNETHDHVSQSSFINGRPVFIQIIIFGIYTRCQ